MPNCSGWVGAPLSSARKTVSQMAERTNQGVSLPRQRQSVTSRLFQGWGGKTALFFSYAHLSHDLTTGLVAAMLPYIRQDLGLNYFQAGLLTSAYALTAGFSQLLGGWLGDKLTRQRAMALGLAGVGSCAILLGLAHSYYAMLCILVGQGVLAGLYHPSAVSGLSGCFDEANRGKAIAMHMVGGSLGFLIGPAAGALIAARLNWHYSFIFLGMPVILASFLVLTRLKIPLLDSAARVPSSAGVTDNDNRFVGAFKVFRSLAWIVGLVIVIQLVMGPVTSFLSLFLVDRHGVSEGAAAMWITVVRLGGFIGSLLGGWLADRWGRRRSVLVTLAVAGPVMLMLANLPFGIILVGTFVLMGCLGNMREATMQTFLMDNTPARVRSTVFGIYFGLGQEGSSLIQPFVGDIMDVTGIYSVFNFFALVAVAVAVLAALAIWRTRRSGVPAH